MSLKIGFCGVGRFARCFVPLFKAHPQVDELVLADLMPERLADVATTFGVDRVVDSLDALCDSDVDAIAIFSQRHLHGPQALQALNAGKHVWCAVPIGLDIDEIETLVNAVERTGLIYMSAETSYYYPVTVFCRDRFQSGELGRFVYGQAHYIHDMAHFYASFQSSGGDQWKRLAGIPPMYYCSHSVSMALSVTGARATHVACHGVVDDHEDEIFRVGNNDWDNEFSNEIALMRTSDGGSLRINELRRVGWNDKRSQVCMSMYGTEGAFEESVMSRCWVTRDDDPVDVTAELDCPAMIGHDHLPDMCMDGLGEDRFLGVAPIHATERLPATFKGLPNGHSGAHQFLVDDFVNACLTGTQPPCHVWNAAHWTVPGIIAHESAKAGGDQLEVPDYGGPSA